MGFIDRQKERLGVSLTRTSGGAIESTDDPPVVARMVIEIRSDGSRTIARGAVEDALTGERVAIEARGSTPMALAASLTGTLTKSLISVPTLARHGVKALLKGALGKK
ncbi:MAG: hypothetical protein SFV15_07840 [Polyangiaceae bacterium]|nr:hypothetical protein [Polyangiaceae bacterium]